MLLINFNLEHGIWEGLKNLTLYLDLVLFWHSFLSLAAGLTLFLYLLVYLLNSLLDLIMIEISIKWQQLTLLQPTTTYSTYFNACPENSRTSPGSVNYHVNPYDRPAKPKYSSGDPLRSPCTTCTN